MKSEISHPPCRLILLHGLASTPREFALIAHPLRRYNVTLIAPAIPGYTHQTPGMGAVYWQKWVLAANERVQAIAAQSTVPYVLGGLCTGAMLAIALAHLRQPVKPSGIALLSPLFAYDGWGLPWWYSLRRLTYLLKLERFFAMHERSPYGLKNERMRELVRQRLQARRTTLIGPARVPLNAVKESERLSRHALATLPKLHIPLLTLHARDDEICRLSSVSDALKQLSSSHHVRMRVLENSYHMITADNDRQTVVDELKTFSHFCSGTVDWRQAA